MSDFDFIRTPEVCILRSHHSIIQYFGCQPVCTNYPLLIDNLNILYVGYVSPCLKFHYSCNQAKSSSERIPFDIHFVVVNFSAFRFWLSMVGCYSSYWCFSQFQVIIPSIFLIHSFQFVSLYYEVLSCS